jgi:beta-galactosidase
VWKNQLLDLGLRFQHFAGMLFLPAPIRFGLFLLACLFFTRLALGNGEIYPATAAAQSAINWKDGYFYINGKPTFLTSGEMHYARIPRELWADRIWRAKQMGFNCVQMYVFWNATESAEGKWDFTDNMDLDAWLFQIQAMGMYAVVRVGPYSCAEWDNGGFPAWLTIKPGMTLRDSGAAYDSYVDRHLAQVEKVVARHQINHGGNVIMVQLENEHPRGWGTDDRDPYLKHLYDQARANGLEIPLFLSGLHHGNDPAGEKPFQPGASPWFTTEFWTGWIGRYGDMEPGMYNQKVAGTWKIISFGGAGYDYYMVHGGTNFGYSGFSHDATYDYSAPIGEAGQLRNFYFPAKRAAWFAQSFSSILTGSHDDPTFARADLAGLRVTTRTNPAGSSIVFIDNFQKKVDESTLPEMPPDASAYQAPSADKGGTLSTRVTVGGKVLPHFGSIKVSPSEPRTILLNVPWTNSASFESVCTNVMMRQTIGDIDYWVCYGQPGDTGEVTLKRTVQGRISTMPIEFTYPAGDRVFEDNVYSYDGHKATFIVMNTELTNKTWLVNGKLYIGPSFVLPDGSLEFPPEGGKATVYSTAGKSEIDGAPASLADLPSLSAWTWRDAAPERAPAYPTNGWALSKGPQALEAYGYQNRYGWYRTILHSSSGGPAALHFSGESGAYAGFLNGQPASLDHLDVRAGDNSLAILVKAGPRPTLYVYTGPIGNGTARGLWGGVSTDASAARADVAWKKWNGAGDPGKPNDVAGPDYNDSSWQSVDPNSASQQMRISRGASWFRGTFSVASADLDSSLQLAGFGGDAPTTLYLNGRRLDSIAGDVSGLLVAGQNTLLLEVQSRKGGSGSLATSLWHNSPLTKATWYFHGGLAGLDETPIIGRVTNWSDFLSAQPWQTGEPTTPNLPTFYKTIFTYHHSASIKETIGLLTEGGLKAGHVWLNGHNLGECPQKIPMYMPECWLKDGENDLVVFDLYGSSPNQVRLTRYEGFSVASAR